MKIPGLLPLGTAPLLFLSIGAFVSIGSADARGEILPDTRRVEWHPGIPGGIPDKAIVCPATAPSVRDFGAVGDGVTDDAAAFQNAIDAAAQGDAIWIPAGDYLLETGLRIDHGVVLCGEGPALSRLLFACPQDAISVVVYDRCT